MFREDGVIQAAEAEDKRKDKAGGWEWKSSLLGPRTLSRKFRFDSQGSTECLQGLQWGSGPIRPGFRKLLAASACLLGKRRWRGHMRRLLGSR